MARRGHGRRRRALSRAAPLVAALALIAAGTEPEPAAIQPLAERSLLLDGAAADGLMVAVGERGHILTSRDEGASWRQSPSPVRAALTGVHLHDAQLGWAVGHDATILRTRDGGDSWELLHYAPEEERPFLDVWFRDAENGFAVGAYGFFFRTTDGGDTWEALDFEAEDEESYDDPYDYGAEYHLNRLVRDASGRLFLAAEAGNVYRSDDGGDTWVTLPSPYEGSFFGALPLEGDSLLLFGLRGHLFRSDDAGQSWSEIATGTQAALTDALRLADGALVVTGLAGTLLVSEDGGSSFTLRQQEDRQGLASALPTQDGGLVLIGEFGVQRLPAAELRGAAAP